MNCQRTLELLHPYIDRELEQVLASEVQQHLEECKECDVSYRSQIALRSSLHDDSFYHRAPADLKSRITSGSKIICARRPRARAKRDMTVPTGT